MDLIMDMRRTCKMAMCVLFAGAVIALGIVGFFCSTAIRIAVYPRNGTSDEPTNSDMITWNQSNEKCLPVSEKNSADGLANGSTSDILTAGILEMNAQSDWFSTEFMNSNSVIFVLGNSDSAKKSVMHILTGNVNRLESTRTARGDFVIIDESNLDLVPNRKFHARIPQYLVHPETEITFWNFPGFGENRSHDADVAEKYFMKSVLDATYSAKFLFVIDYASVKVDGDGFEFDFLSTRAAELLPNISTFSNAIGLVVTNVENFSKLTGDYLTDNQIATEIELFLIAYIDGIRDRLQSLHKVDLKNEHAQLENKLNFAHAIFNNERKFSFVRSPEKCGRLVDMPALLNARRIITALYTNKLEYVLMTRNDYSFTFSDKSLSPVKDVLIPESIKKFCEMTLIISTELEKQFLDKFYTLLNINETEAQKILRNAVVTLKQFVLNAESSGYETTGIHMTASEQLNQLYENLHCIPNCTNKFILEELETQIKFLNQNELDVFPGEGGSKQIHKFSNFLARLELLEEFYAMSDESKLIFGSYTGQWWLSKLLRKNHILIIDANNMMMILLNSRLAIPAKIFSLWMKAGPQEKDHFAKLVNDFVPKLKITCQSEAGNTTMRRIIISGRNVLVSDAFLNHKWPVDCGSDKLKGISIFATEKVYIDSNILAYGRHVSIIAPIWNVVGKVRLDVSGVNPPDHPKARSGVSYGDNGMPGIGGLPGGNGGSFFGVYSQIVGETELRISADGGSGGNGQNGGDGHQGRPGADAKEDEFPSAIKTTFLRKNIPQVRYENGTWNPGGRTSAVLYKEAWYIMEGEKGGKGGDGGYGGVGGAPGQPGKVQVICVNADKNCSGNLSISSVTGKWGRSGVGGKGGMGGKHGNAYAGLMKNPIFIVSWWSDCHPVVIQEAGQSGLDAGSYMATSSSSGLPSAEWDGWLDEEVNSWKNVIDYKMNFLTNTSAVEFLHMLDSNSEILRLMNPLAFAKELETAETIFATLPSLKAKSKLHSFYTTFLNRLNSYGKMSSNDTVDGTSLNQIYASVLSRKIQVLRDDQKISVISTSEYFDAVLRQMETLKGIQKEVAIQQEYGNFKTHLNRKMDEIMLFITNTVWPAIDNAHTIFEYMKEKYIQELNEYTNKAERDATQRRKMMKNYQDMLPIFRAMGLIELCGEVVKMLGPKGVSVGTGMSSAASSARSSLLPSGQFENALEFISFEKVVPFPDKVMFLNNIQKTEIQLNATLDAVKMLSTKTVSIQRMLSNTSKSLAAFEASVQTNTASVNPLTLLVGDDGLKQYIHALSRTVNNTLDNIETGATSATTPGEKEVVEEKRQRDAEILRTISKGLLVVQKTWDNIAEYLEGKAELNEVKELLRKAEHKLSAIEERKKQLYDEILPELMAINEQIKLETNKLSGRSTSGLLVSKWKVVGLLKRIRWYVQQLTKGFKIREQFQQCLDTLDEAFTLLIDLYNHAELLEDKKQFAGFLADLNAASANKVNITDDELREALVRLDFSIHADLFLEEYKRAIHAFKQWVFPFANHYLQGMPEMAKMPKAQSIYELVNAYQEQVVHLRTALAKYKATAVSGDEAMMVTTFTSDAVSSRPFYVWKNSKWQAAIQKLLSGNEVTLKADVDMIGQDAHYHGFFKGKSAIKYKSIELALKVENRTRQHDLDRKLKRFQMKMTHSGMSFYKVLGKHFVMFDRNTTYRYSFERIGSSNKHVSRNWVKYKVDGPNTDFLMSPYTWWTFQLIDATPGVRGGFPDLEEFSQDVNLEMEGEGVYLDEAHCHKDILDSLKLDDYYDVYDTTLMNYDGRIHVIRETQECSS